MLVSASRHVSAAAQLSSIIVHRTVKLLISSQSIVMRPLTVDSLNPAIKQVEYAVRGELAIKAEEHRVTLQEKPNSHGLPFDRVISSNIGNPQQRGLDQPPITFTRQVRCIVYKSLSRIHRVDRSQP